MSIVSNFQLESNNKIKINFDGGDLSSDSGLLLIKEFIHKIGFEELIKSILKPIIEQSVYVKMMKIFAKKFIKSSLVIFLIMILMN